MIRMAIAYNKKDKTVTTEIAQVLLNILVGVLTAVIAVLNTIPTSKEVTDIINTIRDIIILIQDALNNPTLWTK